MLKSRYIAYFFFLVCFFVRENKIYAQKTDLTTREIVFKMLKTIDELDRLKYSLKSIERGKKGYNHYGSAVKLNRKPRKIYVYIKGTELLWVKGWNNNKAYIKPNSFPYINMNLDPLGSLMRQDQHHTLHELGFDYFGSIIEYIALKVIDKFDQYFKLEDIERYNDRPCYKIQIHNKDFGYENYTVGDKESITSIARKLHISEYMILEANPKLNDYFDLLKKGQVLKVPTAYAKDVTMYIDQLYFLPIGIKILDDKGLFEQYDYHYLQVNPKMDEDEFSTSYKEYKF